MSKKRIIEEQATTDIFNDDWLVKDSVTQGTTKIQPSVFKAWINDGMATEEDIETIVENIADTYSTSESYAEGDLCIHEYALFKCIGPTTGTWDSTKWESTTVAEIISTIDLSAEAISYDNTSSGLEAENVQDAIDEVVADVDAVETALETKANTTGTYDDLVVGTAQNLLSESFTEDKVPYNFRQSFNGARLEDEIVGGTVAWNQVADNSNAPTSRSGITITNDGNTFTMNGTVDTYFSASGWFQLVESNAYYKSLSGHKILTSLQLLSGTVTIPSGGDFGFIVYVIDANSKVTYNEAKIYSFPTVTSWTTSTRSNLYATNNVVFNNAKFAVNVIDLTQMFGSTIADYIYSLEQATAGSGVAYFRNLFPKSYYAYNSGTLMSVNASSHDTVGFNQWDEEWEVGGLNPLNGDTTVENDRVRSKNFNPCIPNANMFYYIPNNKGNLQIIFYDKNKTYLGYYNYSTTHTYETPTNCYFYKFNTGGSYGTTYNNDICINISDASKNGTYEPYIKHTYPLDSDLTLRGIPKLDSNNNLYYDGDIYASDGSVTRKYGVVDLGSLTWSEGTDATGQYFQTNANSVPPVSASTDVANVICALYVTSSSSNVQQKNIAVGTTGRIYVRDSAYSTAQSFATAMNGVYLVYELATPTSETADAFINPQIVDARGTEEYVDYAESQGTRDVAIPVGHNSKYYADLKSKIENIPDVPSTNGTYTLKATRSASGVTYAWVSG